MTPIKEILDNFESRVLSAVAQADGYGVPQAEVMRPFLGSVVDSSLRYRIRRMERQNKIRTRDVGGRKLLLPVED